MYLQRSLNNHLVFSTFSRIHIKTRNKLLTECAAKIICIFQNWHILKNYKDITR